MTDSKKPPPTKKQWLATAVIVLIVGLFSAVVGLGHGYVSASAFFAALGVSMFVYGLYRTSKADR